MRAMILNRRAALLLPLALAACGGNAPQADAQTIARVAADVNIVASSLRTSVNQLAALNVINPQVLAICNTALDGIQSASAALAKTGTVDDARPLVQKIVDYVNTIVGALVVLPLPPEVRTVLMVVATLMPVIQITIGLTVQPAPVAPAPMTPDAARSTLAGAATVVPAK